MALVDAWVLAQSGEAKEALSRVREAEQLLERHMARGIVGHRSWGYHAVGRACLLLGQLDEEVLEFRWGPNWLVWDAEPTKQRYAQHVEYTPRPDHTGTSTVVTVDVTVEPGAAGSPPCG